ncbi:MAG: XTP/dITP diphosphatase [Candidatus Brocadiia bacterium]
MKLLVATGNPGKRSEMEELLRGLPVQILSLTDLPNAPEVEEDGATLEENAAKKASEMAGYADCFAVADDSGLFVDALDGEPGVRSARYADGEPTPENLCGKLLREMANVPNEERTAYFRCCIAMAGPKGQVRLTASGRCEGRITREMRGDGGFGYDPVFLYESEDRTFAEMEPHQKNAVSHRGRALQQFRRRFTEFLRATSD